MLITNKCYIIVWIFAHHKKISLSFGEISCPACNKNQWLSPILIDIEIRPCFSQRSVPTVINLMRTYCCSLVQAEQCAGVSCQVYCSRIMGLTVYHPHPIITSTEDWPPAARSQRSLSLPTPGSRKPPHFKTSFQLL